ncbi:hypothetical protein D3Z36_02985 [Lachnospiraceae bacterium]|nr:hypothetical protein [Lachnospiraceae bacterium]
MATSIDDNSADEQADKSAHQLLHIRYTSVQSYHTRHFLNRKEQTNVLFFSPFTVFVCKIDFLVFVDIIILLKQKEIYQNSFKYYNNFARGVFIWVYLLT